MKLLLDENISRRLTAILEAKFPGTSHVELVGLAGATDVAICDYASEHNFVIVTKDEDFDRLSAARNYDPKLVRVTLGNVSNERLASAILLVADRLVAELTKPEIGIVEIS